MAVDYLGPRRASERDVRTVGQQQQQQQQQLPNGFNPPPPHLPPANRNALPIFLINLGLILEILNFAIEFLHILKYNNQMQEYLYMT